MEGIAVEAADSNLKLLLFHLQLAMLNNNSFSNGGNLKWKKGMRDGPGHTDNTAGALCHLYHAEHSDMESDKKEEESHPDVLVV